MIRATSISPSVSKRRRSREAHRHGGHGGYCKERRSCHGKVRNTHVIPIAKYRSIFRTASTILERRGALHSPMGCGCDLLGAAVLGKASATASE